MHVYIFNFIVSCFIFYLEYIHWTLLRHDYKTKRKHSPDQHLFITMEGIFIKKIFCTISQYSFDCFKKIVKHEGGRGLYQGISVNLIGIIPEKAIKLAVNDYMREHLVDNYNTKHNTSISVDNLPPHLGVIAGGTAGFCQVVATK